MKNKFNLGTVLGEAREFASKTASEERTEKVANEEVSNEDLTAALDNLFGDGTKVASDNSEVSLTPEELQQMVGQKVAELAQVDMNYRTKEAHFLGAALFDGFLTRANDAELNAQKIAAIESIEDPDLEKIAEEIGYQQGVDAVMKLAAAEMEKGQKLAAQMIQETKEACYRQGHYDTLQVLAEYSTK